MARDIKIDLTTEDSGVAVFNTQKIKGKLDSIIITVQKQGELAIESELGYTIFHARQFIDLPPIAEQPFSFYIPIRSATYDKFYRLNNMQVVPYYLDEKLKIIFVSSPGTKIQLVLRLI